MLNKGFKKLLAVALLSTIGLVACDKDVHAKPTDYDEPLVALTESEDETNASIKYSNVNNKQGTSTTQYLVFVTNRNFLHKL